MENYFCAVYANKNFNHNKIWAWWYTPVIPAARSCKQEDHEFKASLGYTTKPSLKKKKSTHLSQGVQA
jgi:hypothetical protein